MGKVFKIANSVLNPDTPEMVVEVVETDTTPGFEPLVAYVGIELPKVLHRKVMRTVNRLARNEFENRQKEPLNEKST